MTPVAQATPPRLLCAFVRGGQRPVPTHRIQNYPVIGVQRVADESHVVIANCRLSLSRSMPGPGACNRTTTTSSKRRPSCTSGDLATAIRPPIRPGTCSSAAHAMRYYDSSPSAMLALQGPNEVCSVFFHQSFSSRLLGPRVVLFKNDATVMAGKRLLHLRFK